MRIPQGDSCITLVHQYQFCTGTRILARVGDIFPCVGYIFAHPRATPSTLFPEPLSLSLPHQPAATSPIVAEEEKIPMPSEYPSQQQSRSMRALITRAADAPPMLLTPDEAAVRLRLAPTSVRHLMHDGQLRYVRVRLGGKRTVQRIPAIELQAFVERLMLEQLGGQISGHIA